MANWPIWVWVVLGLLGYGFATAVAHMVTTRWAYMLKRHDLIVAARRRRMEFDREQMILAGGQQANDVIIEDEQPPNLRAAGSVLEVRNEDAEA